MEGFIGGYLSPLVSNKTRDMTPTNKSVKDKGIVKDIYFNNAVKDKSNWKRTWLSGKT
jgi:hypothetical protein